MHTRGTVSNTWQSGENRQQQISSIEGTNNGEKLDPIRNKIDKRNISKFQLFPLSLDIKFKYFASLEAQQ